MRQSVVWGIVIGLALGWEGKVASQTQTPEDSRLVSPYGTVLRSLVLPGWGQIYIRQRLEGTVYFVGVTSLGIGWVVAHRDFRHRYHEVYLPAVKNYGVTSPEAEALYSDVNRRFKVSRFLLFTALGLWGYSLVDAYVDASIYNAQIRAEDVLEESRALRKLQIGWEGDHLLLRFCTLF